MDNTKKVTHSYAIQVLMANGMTQEEAEKFQNKVIFTGTITNLLMDVLDSFLQDSRSLIKQIGATYPQEKEKNLREMRKSYNHFHKHMEQFTGCIFKSKKLGLKNESEDYANDLYEIIKLVADHTNSYADMESIKKSIKRRKCNHHVFEEE